MGQPGKTGGGHCMVVHAYYPLLETRVEREALALIDQGIEVDVICLRREDEEPTSIADGVRVHRLPVQRHRGSGMLMYLLEYLAFLVLAFLRLTRLHLRRHYDVVQVHNLPDFLVFAALVPKLTGAKVILDLHDLMPEFYAERFQRPMTSWPVRLICWEERMSCHFADHIITVTKLWRRSLVKRGQPKDKVTVVMNVADDRAFHRDVAPIERKNWQGLSMIYHGIMGPRHGLDLLLEAMRRLQDRIPDLHLTLHGGGEYRPVLEDMVGAWGLADHVHFSRDFVPTEQLARLVKAADLGVVPYRDGVFIGEILPTKLMEYAALGIPAIAARTPTIGEYFDDTMVEFFTPDDVDELADCILRLYRDQSRLESLGRGISTFTDRYNWSSQSSMYVRLVRQLMEKEA
ncbi:MAG: glycosyltransferase family 4 protein [bacterium]